MFKSIRIRTDSIFGLKEIMLNPTCHHKPQIRIANITKIMLFQFCVSSSDIFTICCLNKRQQEERIRMKNGDEEFNTSGCSVVSFIGEFCLFFSIEE